MDFGKYIHELLLENDIVIVPGFGAFVAAYKPAEINSETGEMKPPAKTVSFNAQIRNNDGLLVGYVAEKKRISHFEALKRIEKERENILYNLDSGERIELNEVGTLYYDENGTIALQPFEDDNFLLDSFGLEATAMEPQEKEESEETPLPPVMQEEVKMEEKEQDNSPHEVAEAIPVPEPESEPAPIYTEQKAEEKKKKRGWLWLLLILIPLIFVSVYISVFDREIIGIAKEQETTTLDQLIEQANEIAKDSVKTIISETDSLQQVPEDTTKAGELIPEAKTVPVTNTPKYYLVGGSFTIEENAETYLKELKDKGFEAFHVGKKGRFFIVGIGTYDTFAEAEKAKEEYMSNNPDAEVWVYKK